MLIETINNEFWNYFSHFLNHKTLYNFHVTDSNGNTLLHLLAYKQKTDFINDLLACGLDVNARNKEGFTTLHIAAQLGNINLINLLLANSADVNTPDKYNRTPIYYAIRNNHQAATRFLIDSDANQLNGNEEGLLHLAAKENLKDMCMLLIEEGGINVNVKNRFGDVPLEVAIDFKSFDAVEVLIHEGANTNIIDLRKRSLLHRAVYKGNTEIIKFLLNYIPIDVQDGEGVAPLHLAVLQKNAFLINMLVEHHANVNVKDDDGYTAIHLASQTCGKEIVVNLMNYGGTSDACTLTGGDTPAHLSASCGNLEALKCLTEFGADLDAVNKDGKTVLDCALMNGDATILNYLKEVLTYV